MTVLLSALLFGAASNLDTLILALTWGLRGGRLTPAQGAVIGGVTTVVTWCALAVGALAGALAQGAALLGPLLLTGLGLWTLLDWLRQLGQPDRAAPPPPEGLAGCLPLAGALAVNNAGMGVAAGVSGLSPLGTAGVNLGMTLLALALGYGLGRRAAGARWSRLALPLSGVLLVLLGLLEMR
jgi:putative Mn2+ efflux pump MntP